MALTDHQAKAILWATAEDSPKLLLWQGDIRCGKTMGAALALVRHSLKYEDADFIVAGKSAGAVERSVVRALKDAAVIWGQRFERVRSRQTIKIGSNEFHVFGAPNASSQDTVQGMTAAGAIIDEAALIDRGFVEQVMARCSMEDSKIILTFNPAHPSHWLFTDFINGGLDCAFYKSTLLAAVQAGNIPQETYDFYLSQPMSAHRRKRWLEGEWAAAAGLCLPSLEPSPDAVTSPSFRRVEAGVDWGTSNPTAAVFFGQLYDGRWQTCGEYYWSEGNRTASEHADAILRAGEVLGASRYIIDPSAASLRLELLRRKAQVVNGNNDVIEGIDTLEDAVSGGRLLVTDDVPSLLSEASRYSWKEWDGPDQPVKKDDHACDAARYFAMSRLRKVNLTPVPKPVAF